MVAEFTRDKSYPGKIVLLDGISGTGKTMIHRIIDSYECNSLPKFSYAIEQICIAAHYNKIEKDATSAILKLQMDQLKFDLEIGREVNLRKNDLSSIFKSTKRSAYLKKIFLDDGEKVISNLIKQERNVVLITHQLLNATSVFENVFTDNFINIHTVRNPVYLYYHWNTYIQLLGDSVKDLTVWKNEEGNIYPWFFKNFENYKGYAGLTNNDKTLVCLIELIENLLIHHALSSKKPNYLCIEFEKFVLDPSVVINKLDQLFNNQNKKSFKRVLRGEKIPRVHINGGKKRKIYKRYGADSNTTLREHKADYISKLDIIKSQTSKLYFDRFILSVNKYEDTFGLWF
jgi:hypothetical protein